MLNAGADDIEELVERQGTARGGVARARAGPKRARFNHVAGVHPLEGCSQLAVGAVLGRPEPAPEPVGAAPTLRGVAPGAPPSPLTLTPVSATNVVSSPLPSDFCTFHRGLPLVRYK
jgi:hypothetical protein